MVSGKVKYVEAEGGRTGFTVDTEYDLIQFATDASGNLVAVVVNDNGGLAVTSSVLGEYFQVTELYAPERVI